MMQWYTVGSLAHYSCCTFSCILPTNLFLWPHITGALSVVSPVSLSHGSFISLRHLDTSSNMSFPVVMLCIDLIPKRSPLMHKLESNMNIYIIYATKSWRSRWQARIHDQLKLTFKNVLADLAVSSVTTKAAFTAASLCDLSFVNSVCCFFYLLYLLPSIHVLVFCVF